MGSTPVSPQKGLSDRGPICCTTSYLPYPGVTFSFLLQVKLEVLVDVMGTF